MYIQSINTTVATYGAFLREVKQGRIQFANQNCDTGQPTRAGEYSLADKTHSQLLDHLNQKQFAGLKSELQRDILKFCSDPNSPLTTKTKKDKKAWAKILQEPDALKAHRSAIASAVGHWPRGLKRLCPWRSSARPRVAALLELQDGLGKAHCGRPKLL